jgi:hypothetical protein
MPGPVYQSFNTSTYPGAAAASHNVTVNKPSGVSDGDILFLTIGLRQDDGVGRTLSTDLVFDAAYPWTKVRETASYNTSAQANRAWTYFRYVANAAGEPASYTCTINYASAFAIVAATITARFSGAGVVQPINASANFVDTGLAVAFPQVTTTLPDTLILFSSSARNLQTAFSFSTATVITFVTVTLTTTMSLGVAYKAQSAAGLSAAETGTWSGGGGSTANGTTAALASDLVASTSWIRA